MSDNKSASDDLSEEKEEAILPPRLSENPHFLLNKYINPSPTYINLIPFQLRLEI